MQAVEWLEALPQDQPVPDVVLRCGCKRGQRGVLHLQRALASWHLSIEGAQSAEGRCLDRIVRGVKAQQAAARLDGDREHANTAAQWRCRGCGVQHVVLRDRLNAAAFGALRSGQRRPWVTVTSTAAPWVKGQSQRLTWSGGRD